MTIRLYLLLPVDDVGYDEHEGFVIRAESPEAAREIARSMCASTEENRGRWADPSRTTCKAINPSGSPCVILSAFNAG